MLKRRFIRALLRLRIPVFLLMVGISVAAATQAFPFRFLSSVEAWFLEGDPSLDLYQEFLQKFESDEIIVLGVFSEREGEDLFTEKGLAAIRRIGEKASKVRHIRKVRSLPNLKVLRKIPFTKTIIPDNLEKPGLSPGQFRERVKSFPLVWGTYVSEDGRGTAIVLELSPGIDDMNETARVVEDLRTIADEESREGIRVRMAGMPVLDVAFFSYSQKDFKVLGPAMAGMILVVTFLVFRRISAALIPLFVVIQTCLWTFGLMGLLGIPFNVVSTALVSVIMAVGVADSIHVLSHYDQERRKGRSANEAVENSLTHLLVPCLFTSLTTAAGFLSLMATEIAPVRQFGWLSAVGVLVAFVLTFTFIPVLLPLVRPSSVKRAEKDLLNRLLVRWATPSRKKQKIIVAVAILFVGLAAWRITNLDPGPNPINYFPKTDRIRQDMEGIDRDLSGSTSFELMIQAPEGTMADPQMLRRLDELVTWIEGEKEPTRGVTGVFSVIDLLKEVQRVKGGKATIPETRAEIEAIYATFRKTPEGAKILRSLVQSNGSLGRMTVRVQISETQALMNWVPRLRDKVVGEFNRDGVEIQATGYVKLITDMSNHLIHAQIRSFGVAFLLIAVLMFLILRNLRLGLFAIIPNLVPIVLGLGLMEVVGITLNLGTIMVGSIALGLVVDDAVHFLFRMKQYTKTCGTLEEAVANTVRETGHAILVTSIALACGFGILCTGSFAPSINFGIVAAGMVVLAVVADLVLLPAALLLFRPRILKKETGKASGQTL
jgi:hydrophobe/amphiphile efflux-3 (HAE3) family protein